MLHGLYFMLLTRHIFLKDIDYKMEQPVFCIVNFSLYFCIYIYIYIYTCTIYIYIYLDIRTLIRIYIYTYKYKNLLRAMHILYISEG